RVLAHAQYRWHLRLRRRTDPHRVFYALPLSRKAAGGGVGLGRRALRARRAGVRALLPRSGHHAERARAPDQLRIGIDHVHVLTLRLRETPKARFTNVVVTIERQDGDARALTNWQLPIG